MLFYGLTTETVPIFGSRKKSYLIIFSILEVIFATTVALIPPDNRDKIPCTGDYTVEYDPIKTTLLLCGVTLSMAFIDTVCDGILVVAQRADPKHGSEDLQVLAWLF